MVYTAVYVGSSGALSSMNMLVNSMTGSGRRKSQEMAPLLPHSREFDEGDGMQKVGEHALRRDGAV